MEATLKRWKFRWTLINIIGTCVSFLVGVCYLIGGALGIKYRTPIQRAHRIMERQRMAGLTYVEKCNLTQASTTARAAQSEMSGLLMTAIIAIVLAVVVIASWAVSNRGTQAPPEETVAYKAPGEKQPSILDTW